MIQKKKIFPEKFHMDQKQEYANKVKHSKSHLDISLRNTMVICSHVGGYSWDEETG